MHEVLACCFQKSDSST